MSLPSEVTDADGRAWVVQPAEPSAGTAEALAAPRPGDRLVFTPPAPGARRVWLAPKPRDVFTEPRVDDVLTDDSFDAWRVVEVTCESVLLVYRKCRPGGVLSDAMSQNVGRDWLRDIAQKGGWTLKRRAEEVDA